MRRRCARLAAAALLHLHLHHLLLLLLVPVAAAAAAPTAMPPSRLHAAAPAAGAPDGLLPEHLLPCLEELLPCTAYLKTAKRPSQTCCTAMSGAAAAEMPCLCRIFADPELLATFNVTRDQMFRLPARCGLPVGCRAGATPHHEPVVEAPPPPAATRSHHRSASPTDNGLTTNFRRRAIALVVLAMAVLF